MANISRRSPKLQNELGLTADETPLKNIIVSRSRSTITFNLANDRRVTGKISKNGIKINWNGNSGSYGSSNSFMKRLKKDCSDPADVSTSSNYDKK